MSAFDTWLVPSVIVVGLLVVGFSVVALFKFFGKAPGEKQEVKLGVFKVTSQSEAGLFLGGGLLLVCVGLLGPAVLGAEPGPTTTTSTTTASGHGEEAAVTTTAPTDPTVTAAPPPPTTTTAATVTGGCTAQIVNPFAAIREEPDPFAQEIRRIPEGSYPVLDWRNESFGGVDSRWLLLSVEGDQGWIEHNLIQIDSTSGCDF